MQRGDLRGLAVLVKPEFVVVSRFYASTEDILASLAAKANAN
jgi:hypothetical protein